VRQKPTGCILWDSDIVDIRKIALFFRLSKKEYCKNENHPIIMNTGGTLFTGFRRTNRATRCGRAESSSSGKKYNYHPT
jgi:hypothetical protein